MSEAENEDLEPLEEPEPQPEPDEDEEEASEEEEPQPQPEPEPEQPSGPSPEDMERRFAKIEGSFKTYKASIDRNLEEHALDLLGCPLCFSTPHPAYVNKHDLGRVPDEVAANVKTFLGYARENEYPANTGTDTCNACEGLGKVKTGSRVAEHMTITCPNCKGYGYTPPPGVGANTIHAAGNGTQDNADALADLEQPDRDAWGEPKVLPDGTLNGNYGKMPQFKQVHPVYGVTANLTPEELVSG